jgi:hypothetical protein
MKNEPERRKEDRRSCLVPVEGQQASKFAQSHTLDLSQDGMGFLSALSIPKYERVVIEIELNPEGESVVVVGRVKWVRRVTGSEKFRYGIKFEKMPAGTRSRITQYLTR